MPVAMIKKIVRYAQYSFSMAAGKNSNPPKGNRYREDKVSQPVGRFGERGFERIQFAGFHQLPDHGRQQVAADCPQEEEAEYQCQWQGVILLFHTISC